MAQDGSKRRGQRMVFLWENFGPYHADELNALADVIGNENVRGIELFGRSEVYGWGQWEGRFAKETLFSHERPPAVGTGKLAWRIIGAARRSGARTLFFCHYERPYVFIAALVLRLLGYRLYLTWDSKFDDYTRQQWRELAKRLMLLPYSGAITASERARDYLRFQGFDPRKVRLGYYTLDPQRLLAETQSAPAKPFAERDFVCVARLVPKKNHRMLLDAFARYRRSAAFPRKLLLCGSGPLESAIREQITKLELDGHVVMRGNLHPAEIAREMRAGLCLLLPSIEEQFGVVVREAQVFGLPVILSTNCGACDLQVRSGVNGFVVESDNAEGLAYFMQLVSDDEAVWRRLVERTPAFAERSDARHFADAVLALAQA